jgi:hypothetical protein
VINLKILKYFSIPLICIFFGCNYINDYGDERRGCGHYNRDNMVMCSFYIENATQNKPSSQGEIDYCLIQLSFQERCKKRLRENSIP